MRASLLQLIKDTIEFKYDLPYSSATIPKTILSLIEDKCYQVDDSDKFAEIIYNSIIEYSFNEFEIGENQLENLHSIALRNKLKYNPNATETTKIRYGFLGEVILYSILFVMFDSLPLIARGYFFNPLENSETKGYDSYHIIEPKDRQPELWFGEVKFHKDPKAGINSVLKSIDKAISDNYLETNILAIQNFKRNLNISGSKIEKIIEDWEQNPLLKISEELSQHNMRLVYPIMLIYEESNSGYDESIRIVPDHVKSSYTPKGFDITIDYTIFFILIPLREVRKIKTDVITWIESKKQLMS